MTGPPSRLFDEARTRRAVVRVRRRGTDQVAGTGVFVGPGLLLTCHHVVAMAGGAVDVELPASGPTEAPLVVAAEVIVDPEAFRRDLAVLHVDGPANVEILACAGPCEAGRTVWSTGFQRPVAVLRDSLPTTAVVGGPTTIRASWLDKADLDVFTLTNAVVGPGLSGAPLVDMETGAMVGLVDAAQTSAAADPIHGFAVSLFPGPAEGPLADLLHANRAEVPAYGQHLNPAGARVLCRRQTDAPLRELTGDFRHGSIYDPSTYASRNVERQIEAFLASSRRLLPIIGPTGVGKTNLLARVADLMREERAVILVRAMHFNPDKGSLAAVLDHALESDVPTAFPGLGRLIVELAPSSLVVLVDGLNEAAFAHLIQARSWVTRTVAWLRENDVRLVVSSRPQFWAGVSDLIPNDLCHEWKDPLLNAGLRREDDRPQRAPREGITVGDFDPDEHRQAAEKYGLAAPPVEADLGRHPFFLRVWAEVAGPAGGNSIGPAWTAHQALSRYLEQTCRRASVATEQAYTVDDVRSALAGLGADALHGSTNVLDRATVDDRFRSDRPLRNALLDLRVLEAAGSGFRFGFDAVAEYVMAEATDNRMITAEGADRIIGFRHKNKGHAEGHDSLSEAMALAVVRREHAGDHALVQLVVNQIVGHPDTPPEILASTLLRLLVEFHAPDDYAAQLRAVVGRVVPSRHRFSGSVVDGLAHLAGRGRASSSLILDLIRPWFVHDDPYPFEWGHWLDRGDDDFDREMIKSWTETPGSAVYKLFATRRADEVFGSLLPWLADRTRLKETTGNVGIEDVAAALLYRHRDRGFEPLCKALFRQDPPTALGDRLLSEILLQDPTRAVTLLEQWTDEAIPGQDFRLLRLTSSILSQAKPDLAGRLEAVLNRVASRTPPESANVGALVEASTKCPGRREAAWDTLERLPAGWPMIEVAWLNRYTHDRPEAVLAVVDRCLGTGVANLQRELLDLFCHFHNEPPLLAGALDRIAGLISTRNQFVAYKVGWTLENLLHTVPVDAPARLDLVDLAHEAIGRGGLDIHRSMAYYTLSYWANGRPQSEDARRLWDALLVAELAEETRSLILEKLIEKCDSFAEVLAALDPLRARLPADDLERELIRILTWKQPRHDYFQTWADHPGPRLDADRFRILRQSILEGLNAKAAIARSAALD
ncbi:serine protease [Singulisphaera acidiphila]|uniref:Trypsin-like serine protease with C-terminal PDZ domain n=1 Tax=Singulisphaera acidiphila (strain ATCC BAA-1392 / DSM 18658 / VKM B-2454 / MOB10) TaxID=886293 RepID=L0D9R8_SINAD|nr:trypsin-like peptidase domain-containing protein [Singulisphaera acidiphila]AGA25366.1 trypsin-like serine protease with C-terminal PDZ domain [Singulisphaera acidiphila DSM 18658]